MTDLHSSSRRWLVLVIGTGALTVGSSLLYGLPFLIPTFRAEGLSLGQAGSLAAAPALGLVAALVAWGAFADRYGERLAMWLGLALTAAVGVSAALVTGSGARGLLLALAGAAGASVNSASGRMVMAWFSVEKRGVAMGVRQMGQPLGVAVAAVLVPPLAHAGGTRLALLVLSALSAAFAVIVLVSGLDPVVGAHDADEREERLARRKAKGDAETVTVRNPYAGGSGLARIHLASALLVVPQFATATFSTAYLVSERGWSTAGAGRILAVVALVGAFGRLASGKWSDIAGSRLGPMRIVAGISLLAMLAVAGTAALHTAWVLLALAVASIVSVADNGLGFTAVAETAGPGWSGRALGFQNTGQNLMAFATGSLVGFLAGSHGYAIAFAVCAVAPLLGMILTPVAAERRRRAAARSADALVTSPRT